MADESFELEDGELVAAAVTGPSSSAADIQLRAQLKVFGFVLEKKFGPNRIGRILEKIRMNFGFNSVNFRNVKRKIRFGPHRNERISSKFGLIRSNPRTLAQLREAPTVLRQRGQPDLARLALGLVDADLRHAMWVLDDEVRGGGEFSSDPALFDAFRHKIRMDLLSLQETGYDEDEIPEAFPPMVLGAAQYAARLVLAYDIDDTFGAVPASAAAVRSLEKQAFRAAGGEDDGITECGICFEEFVDGGQVAVMPCPSRDSRVHKFHPDCISKWLAISNVCPLQGFKSPAIATAIARYSCLRKIKLFVSMYNLAAIARYILHLASL
jgi:hypothetical protein